MNDLERDLTAFFMDARGDDKIGARPDAISAGVPSSLAELVVRRSRSVMSPADAEEAAREVAELVAEHQEQYRGLDPAELAKSVRRY